MAIGGQEAISTLDTERDQNKAGSSSSTELCSYRPLRSPPLEGCPEVWNLVKQ
jgi:hypothetical protein